MLQMPRAFSRDLAAVAGLAIVTLAATACLAAPLLASHDPTAVRLERQLLGPDSEFLLGTDHLGRDELSRLLHGGRATLGIATMVLILVMGIALTVGTVAGYYGGWVDTLLMGLVDLLLSFPSLILAVAIAGMLGPGLHHVMAALSAVGWAGYARIIRGMVLSMRERPFVEAARALGATDRHVMISHIGRNVLGPVLVLATLDMGWIILGISGLSFLGLGAQPPTPEWGAMLQDGRPFLHLAPQLMVYPGAAICLVALGFNLLGDALRDLLDPTTST